VTAAGFVPPAIGELRHWSRHQGWHSQETPWRQHFQLKLWRRKGENVCLVWRDTWFAPKDSWFESPEVPRISVPNPAQACNVLRTHRPSYDFTPLSDQEVIEWLSGSKITWISTLTGDEQVARVPEAGVSTSVSRSQMMRRFLTFAETSFQSVALDAITDVS
jgi:hypothetical protein